MNLHANLPRYIKVREDILASINDGQLSVGDKIPSLHQLMEKYGVSDTTIKKAISQLVGEGVLRGEWGKGVFVAAKYSRSSREYVSLVVWNDQESLKHPANIELVNGMVSVLADSGCHLEFVFLNPATMPPEEVERKAVQLSRDGVIIPYIPFLSEDHLRPLKDRKTPVVFINKCFPEVSPHIVMDDSMAVVSSVAGRAARAGLSKIGFVGCPRDEVYRKWKIAIEKGFGGPLDENLVERGDYGYESGRLLMRNLLERKAVPELVIAYDEFVGYGALKELQKADVSVPGRTQILGVGGYTKYISQDVKVGTISIPFFEMGARAASLLLEIMRGDNPHEERNILPCAVEKHDTFTL